MRATGNGYGGRMDAAKPCRACQDGTAEKEAGKQGRGGRSPDGVRAANDFKENREKVNIFY
ncbi:MULTISPECIES: hypothetical protein [Eisenbergiella]|uniref:Uncharacterized protein n=1 Tax=Eisenbergiella porci TaxID=2652274 RepID=A0A6N7WQ51_9FIRM|nr:MULTISPECIES: hypothetical protein [Eisenbergiella]MSS91550.1 hypothetical protein [Eisenbergiella porci]